MTNIGNASGELYLESAKRKINAESRNVFICYRGMYGVGGFFAQSLYYVSLCSNFHDVILYCAPQVNKNVDFQQKSIEEMKNCKVFVPILTEEFCNCDKPDDDQVRKELIMFAHENKKSEDNITVIPVYVMVSDKNGLADRICQWFFGEENAEHSLNIRIWREIYSSGETDDQIQSALQCAMNKIKRASNYVEYRPDGEILSDKFMRILADAETALHKRPKINGGMVWIGTRYSDIEGLESEKTGDDSLFAGAITLFGEQDESKNRSAMCYSGKPEYRVDHNAIDESQDRFIFDEAVKFAAKEPEAQFYFYNQLSYYDVKKEGKSLCDVLGNRCVAVNDKELLHDLSNKSCFHKNFDSTIDGKQRLLNVKPVPYAEIGYEILCRMFDAKKDDIQFIVQDPIASGGNGTYIMTKENENTLREKCLMQGKTYLCSVYQEFNVPVNLHAIIFRDGVVLCPGSIQVMRTDYDTIDGRSEVRRLMYRGADFLEYARIAKLPDSEENKVNKAHIEKFKSLCRGLCEEIQKKGYRGVIGIDGMIYGGEVRLLEVNCRFQASTALLNRALKGIARPSLQKINLEAWNGARADDYSYLEEVEVKYSNYSYNHIGENSHVSRVLAACEENLALPGKEGHTVCCVESDGFVDSGKRGYQDYAHLFRVVFNTNICWVNEDGGINLDECISEPVKAFRQKIESLGGLEKGEKAKDEELLALKIALLTQGVKISQQASQFLEKRGGLRPATNDAVDIRFGKSFYDVVINAPIDNKFKEFSPFDIDLEGDSLYLFYYGIKITKIDLFNTDPLENRKTHKGFLYSEVAYLSTDRLRVHVTNSCIYKKGNGRGENYSCKFCNIQKGRDKEIDDDSLREVVQAHWDKREQNGLKHFLIGGQSPEQTKSTIDKVCRIVKTICEVVGRDSTQIYAMILPPRVKDETGQDVPDEEGLKRLCGAGLDQISFNIEIFDERCAKKYMPGKGGIARKTYQDCLLAAKDVWRKSLARQGLEQAAWVVRCVRSMIILGLESQDSFRKGMQWMLDNGIQPIISLFRPLKETPLQDAVASSMIYVYKTYFYLRREISKRYERYKGIYILGPDCSCCQNNTLSLPENLL